jgi:hypothetical protein
LRTTAAVVIEVEALVDVAAIESCARAATTLGITKAIAGQIVNNFGTCPPIARCVLAGNPNRSERRRRIPSRRPHRPTVRA